MGIGVALGFISIFSAVAQKKMNAGIFFAFVLFACGGVTAAMSQVEVVSRLSAGEADDSATSKLPLK